jgi:bifunctional non-homologous end joining protein LigD
MQIYVPLNTPASYDVTKTFARALARLLETEHPELVVSEMKKEVRGGKVFIDWSQNDEHKTTISVYSLRAREHSTVSTPVAWDEVEACLQKKDPAFLRFEADQVLARVEKRGDLFAQAATLKQKLPHLAEAPGPDLVAQAEEPLRRASKAKTGAKPKSTKKKKA